jgi:hypothetical protein
VGAMVAAIVMAGAAHDVRRQVSQRGVQISPQPAPSAPTTHHPPTVARLRSVITKRTTPNDRPAVFMVSDLATASPAPTRPTSSPRGSHAPATRARCIPSVSRPAFAAPDAARRLCPGSTRSTPLHHRQRLPRRLLPPVRPGVRADDAAAGAHHARPERRHRHVVGPTIDAKHPLTGSIPVAADIIHLLRAGAAGADRRRPGHGPGERPQGGSPIPVAADIIHLSAAGHPGGYRASQGRRQPSAPPAASPWRGWRATPRRVTSRPTLVSPP